MNEYAKSCNEVIGFDEEMLTVKLTREQVKETIQALNEYSINLKSIGLETLADFLENVIDELEGQTNA